MTDATVAPPRRLPYTSQFAYSIGSIAYGLKGTALGVVLVLYWQIYGLDKWWVNLGIGAALIVDAIAHPMVGQFSDMLRSKWGRRHPFMYFSAVPIALAVYGLLNPPASLSGAQLFIYMMACLLTSRIALAMFEVPSSSLLPEMVPNYAQRTTILGYRYFMGVVAPALMTIFALRVFLRPFYNDKHELVQGQLNAAGYPPLGLMLAILIFASVMISALGTHREIKHMHPPARTTSLGDLFKVIRTTLFNRNFLALTISGIVYGVGTGLISGLGALFNLYFWELSTDQIATITAWVLPAPFVAMALGPILSNKLGKKRAVLLNFYASVIIGVVPISLRLLGIIQQHDYAIIMPVLIIDTFLAGTLGIMGFIIVSSMMADIVEQLQVKTGKRSEGLIFAADALLRQIASGVGTMGTGLLLAFVAFPDHALPGHVPQSVLTNMALVYMPISAITSFISISVISFYSISRDEHESNLRATGVSAEQAKATPSDVFGYGLMKLAVAFIAIAGGYFLHYRHLLPDLAFYGMAAVFAVVAMLGVWDVMRSSRMKAQQTVANLESQVGEAEAIERSEEIAAGAKPS